MDGNLQRGSLYTAKLNGRRYRSPARPVVVVCIDGSAPGYIQQGLKDGILPNIKGFMEAGFNAEADGVIPSFTIPITFPSLPEAPLRFMAFREISSWIRKPGRRS